MDVNEIPDRVSAEPESPFYRAELLVPLVVAVDGVIVDLCIEADRAEGWADSLTGPIGIGFLPRRVRHHGTVTYSLR